MYPLHEIPNPAPAPAETQHTAEQSIQLFPANLRDLVVDDPDYYHRNSSNDGGKRAGTNERVVGSAPSPSWNHESPQQGHRISKHTTHERKSSSSRPHHRRDHHHRRKSQHRDDESPDRHSSSRSELTAYKKVDTPAAPADKNGQYALPPDYNARVEKDRLQRENEAERVQAKMAAATGGFPAMLPGPLGMMARPPLLGGMMMPGLGLGTRPPLMPGGMMGLRPPLLGMGMGMGMPFGGGMMNGFNPNALPGRFGRDVLGRDFAGPGGLDHPIPETYDQCHKASRSSLDRQKKGSTRTDDRFLRLFPKVSRAKGSEDGNTADCCGGLVSGFDGWGRPLPGVPNGMFPMRPPGMPHPGQPGTQPVPERTPSPAPELETSHHNHHHESHDSDPERPEEYVPSRMTEAPPMFRRPPSNDERYHYGDFDSFAFSSTRLDRPDRLRRPYQLKDHDVRQDEWSYFIESLSREAYRHQRPHHHSGDSHTHSHPRLTKAVQDLLRAWQHGYFGPRAVQVYVAKGGKKVYDHGYGVPFHRAAMSMYDGRSVYTDITRHRGGSYSDGDRGSSDEESEDTYDSHEEARFSARERAHRRDKRRRRARERREERRAAKHGGGVISGEWEVHFEYTAPTVHGVKSVKYGEKLPYERPS
ncbi:hypothetical protein QFC22_006572 [Naganishia vaughanmartiniae]|uniref:Uncharacterized protein n=1 Tax=Naganishia vaughanmartiniae TaxID=1424756 RepID=A0ACC2WL40_9TREE|nr:hypothetical protein QFC22_006572 [Naganishia vaughanmartiniae]